MMVDYYKNKMEIERAHGEYLDMLSKASKSNPTGQQASALQRLGSAINGQVTEQDEDYIDGTIHIAKGAQEDLRTEESNTIASTNNEPFRKTA